MIHVVAAASTGLQVATAGNTEDHCVNGSLDDVFGLRGDKPPAVEGELAELAPGDCLVLPAGLYHDVESDGGPSMSLTIRFDPDASPAPPAPPAGRGDLKKFLLRLAMKKAMSDARAAQAASSSAPAPEPPEARSPTTA